MQKNLEQPILHNKKNKGFVLTLEATTSIIIFGLLLLSFQPAEPQSLKELAITQQANDLLRVWSASTYSETEMIKDTNLIFFNNAQVWTNEKLIFNGQKLSKSIATEGILLDESLNETKIRIIVYFK